MKSAPRVCCPKCGRRLQEQPSLLGRPVELWCDGCGKVVVAAKQLALELAPAPDFGGAFDGFQVTSDADPGL